MSTFRFDVVFLDAGGVLVSPQPSRIVEAFASGGFDVDPARIFEAHYHGVHELDRHQSAPEEFGDYLRAFVSRLGLTGDQIPEAAQILDALWATSGLWCEPLPWAAEGLAAISATGIPIVIVSNADGTCADILHGTGLLQVGPGPGVEVAAIVDSGVLGIAKPDPGIFHHALGIAGTTAERAVHVGDAYQYDVRGARAAGVHPVLVDPLGIRTDADCDRVASLPEVVPLLTA